MVGKHRPSPLPNKKPASLHVKKSPPLLWGSTDPPRFQARKFSSWGASETSVVDKRSASLWWGLEMSVLGRPVSPGRARKLVKCATTRVTRPEIDASDTVKPDVGTIWELNTHGRREGEDREGALFFVSPRLCSYALHKRGSAGGEGASRRRLRQGAHSSRSWHTFGRPPRQQCKHSSRSWHGTGRPPRQHCQESSRT